MARDILYDPSSADLAEHFIEMRQGPARQQMVHKLAQVIQSAVEDWLEDQPKCPACGSMAFTYEGDRQRCAECGK